MLRGARSADENDAAHASADGGAIDGGHCDDGDGTARAGVAAPQAQTQPHSPALSKASSASSVRARARGLLRVQPCKAEHAVHPFPPSTRSLTVRHPRARSLCPPSPLPRLRSRCAHTRATPPSRSRSTRLRPRRPALRHRRSAAVRRPSRVGALRVMAGRGGRPGANSASHRACRAPFSSLARECRQALATRTRGQTATRGRTRPSRPRPCRLARRRQSSTSRPARPASTGPTRARARRRQGARRAASPRFPSHAPLSRPPRQSEQPA